ncbi:MAG: adenine phosphoribosyltransferase [Planctomycetota bacterium]
MPERTDWDLKEYIRNIPDFPKPGILFRDITPLLASPGAFGECVRRLAEHYRDREIDAVVAAEARGFVFAAPLALQLEAAFVPIRKPGKLPFKTLSYHYQLEYGSDTLEMHADALCPGQKALVVDDLLATGGTIDACCQLLRKAEASIVGCAFVIELLSLKGAERIGDHEIFSLIRYE